ncbi:MAG: hypothetical protein HKN33_01300 [Pyrinomonadaceae bacterium]|nr:hypothetical protein [Pyrinomonadaceae bacterium]
MKSSFNFTSTTPLGFVLKKTALVTIILFAAATLGLGQSSALRLDVRNLKVEFVAPKKIRVTGEVRGRGMKKLRSGNAESSTFGVSVEARVDFIRDDSTFSLIPTGWAGRFIESDSVFQKRYRPYWYHQGRRYDQKSKKIPIYTTDFWVGPAIIDKELYKDRDEGKWQTFDRSFDFENVLARNRRRYRIVIGLTHDYTDWWNPPTTGYSEPRFFEAYLWVVYGPFDWGTAPRSDQLMTARYGYPVSFTKKGAVITKVEVREDQTSGSKTGAEKPPAEKKKRKKLTRPSKRPSQLEAVNAADKLQVKLNAMPGVTGSTVGLPPFAALLNINLSSGQTPDAITRLVSDIAVEAAYAAPWVGTVRMNLSGDRVNSRVVIKWEDVASFANGGTTFEEFFTKWEVGGDALVAPKTD